MIEIISNQPDNVLAFTAHGQVTEKDYESVLIPAVEAKLKENPKIRLLYNIDSDFSGFEPEALWDDMKVGFQHLSAWEKVAVVSDNQWIVGITKLFESVVPCVKVFDGNQLAEATEWIKS